jgi:ubiquinone/menaquinone biosynthesis C-methylase UbiE
MGHTSEAVATLKTDVADAQECYADYYAKKGADRNSLLENPSVLFQVLAQDAAMIRGLRSAGLDPQTARALDVGCGDGASLWLLMRLGFEAGNLHGVDLLESRIAGARARHPLIHFDCADATRLPFEDGSFDLVMESTMFIHATDEELARRIAAEMIRVTKPGGTLLISDWRYAKPRNRHYKAVTKGRLAGLFQAGVLTNVQERFRGSLLPPVGRFFSRYSAWSYFAVQTLFPFLTGHMVTVLKKTGQLRPATHQGSQ